MEMNSIMLFADGEVQAANVEQGLDVNQVTEVPAAAPEGAKTDNKGGGGSGWMSILMLVAIFAVFYFFMIRPQRKQQKELQKKREAMKKGDRVVTAGGIFGEIKEVQDTTFIITISKDVTIKVSKESVYADLTDATKDTSNEKK